MKYVSGRVKELKVGISSHSESKTTFITVGNVNVSGSVTATSFIGDGSALTNVTIPGISTTGTSEFTNLDLSGYLKVAGVSTFTGAIDANGQIVGAATSNIIPFLYSNYSLFPSATTYHGAVAHAHNTGKLYYAHGGNWIELVSQETTGTVGTGTERYNIGPVDLTTLDVSGISTFAGNINANGNIVGDSATNISGINSVTATSYFGDGSGLENTGATLSAASGTQRLVLTSLTSGTMTSAATDADLAFDAASNLLSAGKLLVSGISTFTGDIDANGNLDVDGRTDLDDVVVAGVSTFSANATFNGSNTTINNLFQAGGNVDLGGSSANTISANGRFDTSLIPSANGSQDLGQPSGPTRRWRTLHANSVNISGVSTFTKQLNVGSTVKLGPAGVVTATTFKGDVDAVNIDVDGRADIDDLIVTGVSTFQSAIDSNAGVNIAGGLVADSAQISDLTNTRVVYAGASGELQDSSNLTFNGTTLNGTFSGDGTALSVTIPGISTSGTSEFSNLNLSGIVTAAGAVFGTAKVSDLTDNRVVVAGTAGELEDSTNLTFDGSTLSIIGNATFTGNVTVGGTLTSEDKTNIDSIGIVTARTGVRINSGGLVVTAGVSTFSDAIDSNNGANISGGVGLVAATAKVSDLTSGRVVVAGTAGELEDSSAFTFSGGTVSATAFSGDGSGLTGITAGGVGAIGGLTVKDEGVVVGTAGSVSTIDFRGGLINVIATAGAAGVATATITSESNPTLAMLSVTGVSTFQSAVGISSDLTLSSTDTGSSAGPIVNLYRNSASPADADYLGQIKFQGESDTGVQRNYAKITGKILDASNGTEDGILEFAFLKAGSNNISGRFRSDSLQLLNGTNFSVDGTSTFTGDASFNSGLVTINPIGANHSQLTINSLESGSTAGPILKFARDDGAPNDNDFLGIIKFDGSNSTGSQLDYVQVIGKIDDVTNGSEDGTLVIKNVKAGTATTIAEFRSDSLQLLNGTNFSVAGTSDFTGDATFTNDINANGNIVGDTVTNITGIAGVTALTLSGTLQTAAQPNITSLGTLTSLTSSGTITAADFNSTSDARLKTNVQTITSPLEKLNQIDGVSFDWVEGVIDESSSMGVIADTVEKVLPVLVAEHATGYKTVNYNGLIGLLIEAVKEQQVQITELKSKLDSLS